ncbi:MAG: hypothetical protein HY983_00855 [Candidatus Magasanikbacteria bacterium]|nr:hypothetical protein [Candidatus Magasanikbacteria bacterium]
MKICMLLQRRFAFVAHHIAHLLQETYGVSEFCGYAYWRPSYDFLRTQKDIQYSALLLDEDIHATYKQEKLDLDYLRWLEKEFGLPYLWDYMAIDRILMFNQMVREYPHNTPRNTHEEMLRILQVKAKAILAFWEKEKPDALVLPNVGGIGAMLLFQLAKKHGAKILHISPTTVRDNFTVSETYDSYSGAEERFKRTFASGERDAYYQQAQKKLLDFRAKPVSYNADLAPDKQPVNRLRQLNFLQPKNFLNSIRWFFQLLWTHFTTRERFDYSYIHPWYYLVDHIKRKARNLRGANDLYVSFDPKVDYAFFALHLEPEVALLLQAPFVTDQLYAVRQMARSLPVGYVLYVKDHPQMVPFRPRTFYKELKKIPNVRLISPTIVSFDIIKHAKLVTTITGSVIWEGLLLGKPAIVFGHQFYNALSMVKYVAEMEKLPYLVKEQLTNFKYNEEEILHYMAAMLADSAELRYTYLWERETDEEKKKAGLKPMADLMARKLNLTPKTAPTL